MANVQSIITDAIYLSLQDRQFQSEINAGYLDFGLNQLNLILDEWRNLIPFAQTVTFNNVDDLENSTFYNVDTVNFILNTTSQTLTRVTLTRFKEQQAIIGLVGIPSIYYFDELTQSIMVYPRPSNPQYQFTVWGRIQQVTLGMFDEVPANMPPFMRNAVIYELAFRLANNYGVPFENYKELTHQSLVKSLKNKKSFDLRTPRNIAFGLPNSSQIPPFPWLYYVSGGT
jgi:hypothetical protein